MLIQDGDNPRLGAVALTSTDTVGHATRWHGQLYAYLREGHQPYLNLTRAMLTLLWRVVSEYWLQHTRMFSA